MHACMLGSVCLMLVLLQLASLNVDTHYVQQHGCTIYFEIQNMYT